MVSKLRCVSTACSRCMLVLFVRCDWFVSLFPFAMIGHNDGLYTNDGVGCPTNIDYSINHFIFPYLFELNSNIDHVTISFVYSQAAKRCMLDKGSLNYFFYPRIIA